LELYRLILDVGGNTVGKLDGKVAIISGAGAGLGRGIALALGNEGAKVATIELVGAKQEDFMQEMTERGYEAMFCTGDVSKKEDVNQFVQQVVDKWETIDIVVNNAMSHRIGPFIDVTDEDIQLIFQSACMGTINCMQAAFPYLKKRGGKVINFGSIAGLYGMANSSAYGMCKEAIVGLTRCVALEWAPYNIQVNAIAPAGVSSAWERFKKQRSPEYVEAFLSQIPAHRMGDPEKDIGRAVAFLASEDSNWITARCIPVDGGQAATR